MHTVFSVDELLFHIFTLIGDTSDKDTKRDLAILARTCKAFNGVALRILWQDLNEAIPLFSLLPVVTKVYSILKLTGSLTPHCWDRFHVYASLVQSLHVTDAGRIDIKLISAVEESLKARRPIEPLLPNLRKLKQSSIWRTASLLPFFLSSELLEFNFWGSTTSLDEAWYHTFLSQALAVCHHLRSLSVGYTSSNRFRTPESHTAARTFAEWLTTASALEDLNLSIANYLSPATLQLVSSLPRLKRFALGHCEIMPTSPDERVIREGFKSLRHLHLYIPIPVATALPYFNWPLSSLEVCAWVPTPPDDLQKWLSDSQARYGRNLKKFYLGVEMEESWNGSGLIAFVSGTSLTRLEVAIVKTGFNISDQLLEDLGSTLPSLEELIILPFDILDRKATVWGILRLLTHCTKMKLLDMVFIAIVEEDDIRSRILPKSNLVELRVGSSPIGDAGLVAELFSKVFSQLESITWDGIGQEDDEADSIQWKWEHVWDCQLSDCQ